MNEPAPSAHAYLPFGQVPTAQRRVTQMHLHVRAADGVRPATLLEPLRNELMRVDSALPVLSLKTMIEHRDQGLFTWSVRAAGQVFSMLGGLALFLAVVGAYGVKAFLVTRRTREIGVRLALGASVGMILRQVLREGLWLMVGGAVLGTVAALGVSRLIASQLYKTSPYDPVTMFAAIGVLFMVGLAACLFPARRATRISPLVAMTTE